MSAIFGHKIRLSLRSTGLHLVLQAVLVLASGKAFCQVTLPSGSGDIGSQINAAEASLPASGGKILIETPSSGQCYSFSTPVVISKAVIVQGQGPSTCLNYTGSGTAFLFEGTLPSFIPSGSYADGFGLRDLTLQGTGASDGQTALELGGTSQSVGFYGSGLTINSFGLGLKFGRGVWNFKMEHSILALNAQNVYWASTIQFGGENLEFDSVTFVGATFQNSVEIDDSNSSEYSNLMNLTFQSCNFDSAQLVINNGAGGIRLYAPHFENAGSVGSGSEPFVRISAFTAATDVVLNGPDFYNDQNSPYPPSFLEIDGGPTVMISQLRSVNLDGTNNVPTNVLVAGDAHITMIGTAPLRAAQTQYTVTSGNPHVWIMGDQQASNNIISQAPLNYSQSYGPDSQSPVVQVGGDGYAPSIGLNLWTGTGSSYYGVQLKEGSPDEIDFCSAAPAAINSGSYVCQAGVANGIFTSTIPDGTAPLSVVSHTPPDNLNAWPATYSPTGGQIQNPHLTTGKAELPPNGEITIPFQSSATFTQTPTCTLGYQTGVPIGGLRALSSNPTSTSITIFGQPYIGVYYICVGN